MVDHGRIGSAMADLARALAVPDTLEERLSAVTSSSVTMIAGVKFADILLTAKGRFDSVAATDRVPIEMDALQQDLNEGPCLDAARSEPIIRVDDLRTDGRWPRFAAEALKMGVHSMLSLKLYTGGVTIGALNLFGLTPDAFDAEDEEIGSILATHAAIALQGARENEQFQSALASRDMIGQAKGVLMERFGFDPDQAYALLSSLSQNNNIPVTTVASLVIESRPDGASGTILGIETSIRSTTLSNRTLAVGEVEPARQAAIAPPAESSSDA